MTQKSKEEHMTEKPIDEITMWLHRDLKMDVKLPSVYLKKDRIHLQFWGWAIVLLKDGSWFFEDTSGG